MAITIDIGGEGRHAEAWNVNISRRATMGPFRGELIPRLLVARADALPFADGSVARVIVERTPLRDAAIAEVARVATPDAEIILRHVPVPWKDVHARAIRRLGGQPRTQRIESGGRIVQETRITLG